MTDIAVPFRPLRLTQLAFGVLALCHPPRALGCSSRGAAAARPYANDAVRVAPA
jgi:hypothetical protein